MSAAVSPRALLRRQPLRLQLRRQVRRYADTTEKAKETANNAKSKAGEGLSRVQTSAGSAASRVGSAVSNTMGRIGGRTGRLINVVQSMIPPTIYYSKVCLELSKIVFQGQKMSPPSLQQFQSYFSPMMQRLRNPASLVNQAVDSTGHVIQNTSTSPEAILQRVRNVDRAALARGGVVAAEVLGFFTVGEMLGRFKIIGYRGGRAHETATPHGE